MKRLVAFSTAILITTLSYTQIILPNFETRSKVEVLSDEGEESNIFTYNYGEKMFFYRTYVRGEGSEMEVIRQNIWFSEKKDGKWTKPDRLFRMVENEEDLIIGSSEDGNKVYIFKTVYFPLEDSLDRKIGFIERTNKDDWSDFEEIQIPGLVLGENYYHFHLSHDEKILMVSMSPSEDLLDEDLYVSFKNENGGWSELKSLGPIINTKRVEISPFIANDGKTLFFSSEGHDGYGGTDVFVSYRLDDSWTNWTKPKNLGPAINSKDYEENLVFTRNNEYYFTSNKDSESADIYYSSSKFPVRINTGKALAMKGDQGISLVMEVLDKENHSIGRINSKSDGTFQFNIKDSIEGISFRAEDQNAVGTFIYTLDDNDQKIERKIIGSDLRSYPEDELKNDQSVVGSIQAKGQPMANTEVEVYDVNDYLLAKIMTDEKGNFTYPSSSTDGSLRLHPKTDKDWSFTIIRLMDGENKMLGYLKEEQGRLDKSKLISEEQWAKNAQLAAAKKPEKSEVSKPSQTSTEPMETVYFGFNAISLEDPERRKIWALGRKLKKNSDQTITLVGHTDNEGSVELNNTIGEKRAQYVKRALVKEGVDEKRITIVSEGQNQPIASNEKPEGRAKNRRVEIKVN